MRSKAATEFLLARITGASRDGSSDRKVAFPMRATLTQARVLNRAAFELGFSSGGALVRALADLGEERLCKFAERALPKIRN